MTNYHKMSYKKLKYELFFCKNNKEKRIIKKLMEEKRAKRAIKNTKNKIFLREDDFMSSNKKNRKEFLNKSMTHRINSNVDIMNTKKDKYYVSPFASNGGTYASFDCNMKILPSNFGN